MANPDTGRDVALARVAEQEARIKRQERMIEAMRQKGLPTDLAEELLTLMRNTLGTLRTNLNHRPDSN